MKHVMMDLETLATGPKAKVIEVAAIEFDPWDVGCSQNIFYSEVKHHEGKNFERVSDTDTALWWKKQVEENGAVIPGMTEKAMVLDDVAIGFMNWWQNSEFGKDTRLWSWGIDFDLVIWVDVLASCGLKEPWNYARQRDARTLAAAASVVKPLPFHVAVSDAMDEVRVIQQAVAALMIPREGGLL